MTNHKLIIEPITAEKFAPYGEVIERNPSQKLEVNGGRFDRFPKLANVDTADKDGFVNISIFHCRDATVLPHPINMLERHPLGSQAFMALSEFKFIVVVAQPGESVDPLQLRAFQTDGNQGVNLNRGVWHLPLIGQEVGQEFLVVDRGGGNNYDEYHLPTPVMLAFN